MKDNCSFEPKSELTFEGCGCISFVIFFVIMFIGIIIEDRKNVLVSHKVEITLCTGEKILTTVYFRKNDGAPSYRHIENRGVAVPRFDKYLNVCNVETVK